MKMDIMLTTDQCEVTCTTDNLSSRRCRIICCQGAAQLASALAAMWQINGRSAKHSSAGREIENHLVVHDLHSPNSEQALEFYHSIRHLAAEVESWSSYTYLGSEFTLALNAGTAELSSEAMLRERLGLEGCSELYLSQNSLPLYDLLRRTYPQAEHICFGDGVGMNFSSGYLCCCPPDSTFPLPPIEGAGEKVKRSLLKRWAERVDPPFQNDLPIEEHSFDQFCLLLPNLFDQNIGRYRPLGGDSFVELFRRFAESFEVKAPGTHAALTALTARPGSSVILLSSWFSELGMMPRDVEVEGYREMLARLPSGPDVDLIIKPHPRDSYEKLALLREVCAPNYRQTLALSDPWAFYLPIESLYSKYFHQSRSTRHRRSTYVAAVASSCITLEYLYGQRCEVGFHSEDILRQCSPAWRKMRTLHEYDLDRILIYVRKLRNSQSYRRFIPDWAIQALLRWNTARDVELSGDNENLSNRD